jgi:cytochrome c553
MADIAAYYGAQGSPGEMMKLRTLLALSPPAARLAASGDVGKKKSTTRAACHGAEGVSPTPDF